MTAAGAIIHFPTADGCAVYLLLLHETASAERVIVVIAVASGDALQKGDEAHIVDRVVSFFLANRWERERISVAESSGPLVMIVNVMLQLALNRLHDGQPSHLIERIGVA